MQRGQCPFTGGVAVYSARALLRIVDEDLEYDDVVICIPATKLVKVDKEIVEPFYFAFPNPALNETSIKSTDGSKIIERISITDLYGKEVLNIECSALTNSVNLNLRTLIEGIYICRINSKYSPSSVIKLNVVE